MKVKKPAIIFILVAAAAVFALWWFFLRGDGGYIPASGTIEAIEVEVSTKVPGTVLKLNVSEGDEVLKGAVLAQIDDDELSALYDQAKGLEEQAKSARELAMSSFKRTEKLYKDGVASSQVYDQAKTGLNSATAALRQAEAARELAGIRLKDATIKSPVAGYVTTKAVEEGELVSAGSPIVTISDLSKVYIMLYVTEVEVGKIKLGNAAYVTVDSYPGIRFDGTVTFISKRAEFTPKNIQTRKERVTQVFAVKVEVPNPNLRLKPGLPADALIKI